MITIKEVAKRANVSSATVSRMLNDSGYVSEEARERILKVIEETGYVPSENAKSLRTKKTKVIGVILPKLGSETTSRMVNGLDRVLAAEGYQLLLANTNLSAEKEIEFLKLLKSRDVEGIILSATNTSEQLVEEIQKLKIPFVVVGQDMPDTPSVVFNEIMATQDMIEYLIEKGHEKVAFIGVSESDRAVGLLRKKGYLAAMEKHGLPIEEHWIQTAFFDVESGYQAMKNMIEESAQRPTAVFAVTDRLAIGAMNYIKEAGLRIPEDMALTGVGASELSQYVTPSLTTVDFQYNKAGQEAANLILSLINQKNIPTSKIVLDYGLVKKDSV
ncbi:LacI family DNA-binding transcriptional regulator [Rossellomorea oryzaecorticis]|uniref:LacI family DNA-binding transcriptional regulator n=1 Tax=Rossellomorea oryzaecorticis TaxID=1396505 RepID=A0ABU9K429_9BACI